QVESKTRTQLLVFDEKLHPVNIVTGKAKTWIGVKLQQVIQRVFIPQRMGNAQAFDHLQNCLE
ncbi:hypothetical protein AO284_14500, partial [Pseudomonas sp. NZIPFR-PS2]